MDSFVYLSADESRTDALGAALAKALPNNTVVALYGTLGAGKTRLVQAIAEACGVDRRDVTSPTFVLAQEYHAQRAIYHLDAYRLNTPGEFLDLGAEEYFRSGGLVLIEWADRVESCLPPDRIEIRIEVEGDTVRRFGIVGRGPRCSAAIELLAEILPR